MSSTGETASHKGQDFYGPWKYLANLGAASVMILSFAFLLWTAQQNALEERTLCREHMKEIRVQLQQLHEELRRK